MSEFLKALGIITGVVLVAAMLDQITPDWTTLPSIVAIATFYWYIS